MHTAARSSLFWVEDYPFEAAPLEVRVALGDRLLAESGELQQCGHEVEVGADGSRPLSLWATRDTNSQVDDGCLVIRDGPFLLHLVCAIHLPMVAGEDDDRVLP